MARLRRTRGGRRSGYSSAMTPSVPGVRCARAIDWLYRMCFLILMPTCLQAYHILRIAYCVWPASLTQYGIRNTQELYVWTQPGIRSSSRRLAHDQLVRHLFAASTGGGRAAQALQQHLGRAAPQVLLELGDRRERRADQLGGRDVVEADHGDIVR